MSTSSSSSSSSEQPPTLDLHGLTREEALQQVTDFLERQLKSHGRTNSNSCCCIVTGQGHHSSDTGGPVLKPAVERYLRQRKFDFSVNHGSFLVKLNSGGELYYRQASCEEDSKIKVVPRNGNQQDSQRLDAILRGKKNKGKSASASSSNGQVTSPLLAAAGPSVRQVAREESDLSQAKEASLRDQQVQQKQERTQEKEYQRALQLSQQHEDREKVVDEQLLHQAMELSKEQEQSERQEEEELLQEALQESQKVTALVELADAELEQALQESQSITTLADAELEQALQQSLAEAADEQQGDASEADVDEEEERMLQQVMALSLQES